MRTHQNGLQLETRSKSNKVIWCPLCSLEILYNQQRVKVAHEVEDLDKSLAISLRESMRLEYPINHVRADKFKQKVMVRSCSERSDYKKRLV